MYVCMHAHTLVRYSSWDTSDDSNDFANSSFFWHHIISDYYNNMLHMFIAGDHEHAGLRI